MTRSISVIVPIFNVEALLPRCIESICNQTYINLEIILVNDGSTDESGQICEEYARRDERIKVVHKKNGGLSDARNTGIKLATGEFIAFVDSDDYIVHDAYEKLITEAFKYDLDVICSNALVSRIGKEETSLIRSRKAPETIFSGIDYMCENINNKSFSVCVWLNLYKSSLIKENEIFFEKGLLHEDEEWSPRIFLAARKVKYIDFITYVYVIRENSISNAKDKSLNGLHIVKTCYKMEAIFDNVLDRKQKKILMDYLLFIFLGGVFIGRLDRRQFKGAVRRFFVVGKANSVKNLMKSLLFLFSPKLYSTINAFSKELR